MIAVIADDFTGAAEIGGIGLRRGLKTVIETSVVRPGDTDLLIIATDTRSGTAADSIFQTEKITKQLLKLNPLFIYKKLDSVLRGNVAEELLAQMRISGKTRAIVVAGNPNLGRIIKDGVYYVNGIPVAETFFAQDPEFPVHSSLVTEIIGAQRPGIYSLSVERRLPDKSLIFGDVESESEMEKWAGEMDGNTIPAGGAGFFDTLLSIRFPEISHPGGEICQLGNKVLFVFGSAYPKDSEYTLLLEQRGFSLMVMPERIYQEKTISLMLMNTWAEDMAKRIAGYGRVIMSVSQTAGYNAAYSAKIRDCMGKAVRKVFENISVDDLLIEGGATTSVILKYLGVSKLIPFRELDSGVIQMKTGRYPGLCITTKPGSYVWPECLILDGDMGNERKSDLKNHK